MKRAFLSPSLLLLAGAAAATAVQTEKLNNDTFADFAEGEAHGITIASTGFLRLGPAMSKWGALPASVAWAVARDSRGVLYVAAGNEGRVYKVGPDGKASEFFKAAELQIQTLALDPEGNLYAGSSPDGKVYRIGPDGKSAVFFEPKEKYIWALQFDGESNLFVATGDKGKLYKVSRSGKGAVFYDSDETHLRTLLLDGQKRLWVGSEGNGLVFRFDKTTGAQGAPFVAYDSSFREIKALAATPSGAVFVAAMGDGKAGSASLPSGVSVPKLTLSPSVNPGAGIAVPSVTVGAVSPAPEEGASSASQGAERPGSGEIVRIQPDGTTEKWWSDNEDVYTLLIPSPGKLWAGTGRKGRLIEITAPRQYSVLGQLDAETLTSLLPDGREGWIAATSNPGVLWRISMTTGRQGTFDSRVFDTHASSRWGVLDVKAIPGAGRLGISTRSGNTSKPDKVWSDWSPVDAQNRVTSPIARFIQYRLSLSAEAAAGSPLTSVDSATLYYLPANQPPRLARITLLAPNIELGKAPKVEAQLPPISPGMPQGAPFNKGAKKPTLEAVEEAYLAAMGRGSMLMQTRKLGWRSALWQASDPNNDELRYRVSYRAAGSEEWKVLKDDLDEPFLSWDAATWPDGGYYLKVAASDRPSNQDPDARGDEMTSDLFVVDNTAPSLEADVKPETLRKGYLEITVRDSTSIVDEAEYSLDGQDWRPLMPVGGLYDSKSNIFRIPIQKLAPGDHYVVVRASDSANNIVSATIRFRK